MTTRPAVSLTSTQKEIALWLVDGTFDKFAAHRHRSPVTIRGHLSRVRIRMAAPGSSRAVLVHVLLSAGQVPPPTPNKPAPDFTDADQMLMRALAQHSRATTIAEVCGLPLRGLRNRIDELCTKAGAADPAHLVALGHSWQVLAPAPMTAEPTSGATQ
ncbi:hypothetical protein ACFWY6_32215 [Streptomyces sp. NPDC059037]|uniref:hypothetical protein n=1 Tax=Streptomyces sp. NPDC059037 TaxID=3346710 RepID=UPI00369D880F